jgi:hypothetical protein
MNSLEIYSLMARSLRGECTGDEDQQLTQLLNADVSLKKEFEFFKSALQKPSILNGTGEISDNVDLKKKLAQITHRLTNEGSL